MRILYAPNTKQDDGCALYRQIIPAKALNEIGHKVDYREIDDSFPYEMVVFPRFYRQNLGSFISRLKQAGIKIGYETDDLVSDYHLQYNDEMTVKKARASTLDLMNVADFFTTTTPYLADELKKMVNKNTYVLPNSLPLKNIKQRERKGDKLRVGFSGGILHILDLVEILDAIKYLQRKYDFEFILQGLCDSFDWKRHHPLRQPLIKKLTDALDGINYTHIPWTDAKKALEITADLDLDIGLCPLFNEGSYNLSKSAVKFYEYTAIGTATLASKHPVYSGEVPYTVNNRHSDWFRALDSLLKDESLREEAYLEGKDFVESYRDISNNVYLWEDAYIKELERGRNTKKMQHISSR